MVRVDDVYQKVLALANKEQRGYITPQDFNLFANQAQMELFEQYFYDVNTARRNQGNDTVYADIDDMLEEKLQIFEQDESTFTWVPVGLNQFVLPDYVYRVHRVNLVRVSAEILNTKDFNDCMEGGMLLNPTNDRPVANIRNNIITCVAGGNTNVVPTNIWFFRIPNKVNWTYVVINKQAMYDANITTNDFELHPSEENQLINKILKLAGIANEQPEIMNAGHEMDTLTVKQQPKI